MESRRGRLGAAAIVRHAPRLTWQLEFPGLTPEERVLFNQLWLGNPHRRNFPASGNPCL